MLLTTWVIVIKLYCEIRCYIHKLYSEILTAIHKLPLSANTRGEINNFYSQIGTLVYNHHFIIRAAIHNLNFAFQNLALSLAFAIRSNITSTVQTFKGWFLYGFLFFSFCFGFFFRSGVFPASNNGNMVGWVNAKDSAGLSSFNYFAFTLVLCDNHTGQNNQKY